ncbi:MAG: SIMPL domain-containing protein [Sphaerochaetaceae bacterium]|jgi:uncharacterized protein|nr:SIMPL domain-containing protein [Sphaerochaetaceae bacterium]NLY06836.1 SIMPL domain-containing protein [Spirochaetales bacterium]
MKRNQVIVIVLSLAMVLILASCQTASSTTDEFCQISVQGTSTVKLEPDVVNFTVRVSETAPTTKEAQQLSNAKVSSVLSILDSFGIEKKHITTNNLSFSTDYSWESGKQVFVAERVTQQISVVMHDLAGFSSLIDELGSKLTGISFDSVVFDREDKTEFYREARIKAIEDARSKAESYALASGLTLDIPVSINDGSAYVSSNRVSYPKMMAAEAVATSSMSYDTEVPSGELEISASISVVFRAY